MFSRLWPTKYVAPVGSIRQPVARALCNSAGMSGRFMKPNRVPAPQSPSAISSQHTRSASRIQGTGSLPPTQPSLVCYLPDIRIPPILSLINDLAASWGVPSTGFYSLD